MSAAIRAGRAFVELFLKDGQLTAGLNAAKVKMQAWRASAEAMGTKMLGIGAMMTTPFALATKAASDMQETMSKLRAVFGNQADGVVTWMDGFTQSVGRGKKETADGLAAFQAFFVGMGMGANEAAGLSKEMTALAVDFGSFHNVADAEAMQRFISAFSGSSEVLDMFGINIKQTALDLKLVEMGFPKIAEGASELQKVLARQAIIKEAMGKQGAIGDAIRTADSFSNTFKRVSGEVMTAAIEIGAIVMPVFRDLMKWFSTTLKSVMEWASANKGLVVTIAQISVTLIALGASLVVVGQVLGSILTLMAAVKALRTAMSALTVAGFAGGLLTAVAAAGALAYALGQLGNSYKEVSTAAQELSEQHAKQRTDDESFMKRLEQLAAKQNLTNKEWIEASDLIKQLQDRYGDLGLSIDATTGKISGMTEAQKKLTEVMKQQQLLDLQREKDKANQNLQELAKKSRAWEPGSFNFAFSTQETVNREQEQIVKDLVFWLDKEMLLRKQIEAIKSGSEKPNNSAVEVEKRRVADLQKAAEEKKNNQEQFKAGQDAAAELAKIEDEKRREKLSQVERDVEDAVRRGEERKALIDRAMAGQAARPDGPNAGVLEELNAKRDTVHSDVEKEIAEIRKKAADDEAARVAQAISAQQHQIAMKELELKFAARAGETEAQAAAREHDKRLAMIELERQQALANIKPGEDPALVNRNAELDKALENAQAGAQGVAKTEGDIVAMGSFSSQQIGRGFGAFAKESPMKKTEMLQEQIRDVLVKIEKKEGGLPVVGDNE